MSGISYGIFNECNREALELKRTLRDNFKEELPLNFHFRTCTAEALSETLSSATRTSRLPDVIIFSFPFYRPGSFRLVSRVSDFYPGIKILLLTKTEERKTIDSAFHEGASGAISADSSYEAIVDSCLYLMKHEHLDNKYFNDYVERSRKNKSRYDTPGYVPNTTDIKIAEGLRDELTQKEIAELIGLTKDALKHRIEKINEAIGNDKGKSLGIVLYFIRHGCISDNRD